MKNIWYAALIVIFSQVKLSAADLTQTVRGTVLDKDSKETLPGANIIIMGTEPVIGTTTDIDGKFRLENVPVGRINLQVVYLGYEQSMLSNLMVSSGKELVLTVELVESLTQLDEVQITATEKKSDVQNEMSLISSRSFSVEETKRYAGSFNDPARMASSYAGVVGAGGGNSNEIIVRGNSPKGILWRMEGVEIPNPNHFTDEGSTGGPINALNSDMLANSDFYTSAFAPEYGNALSGVFDVKLRTGNNEKAESSFEFGMLGIDVATEGPIKKNKSGSYLFNYRYSSLGLISDIGVVDFGGIPRYQDLSFNIKLPTNKLGTFSLFGLGGLSGISEEDSDTTEGKNIHWRDRYGSKMGVVGLSNVYSLSKTSYLKNVIALSGNGSSYDYFESDSIKKNEQQLENSKLDKYTLRLVSKYNNKINAKNNLQAGFIYSQNYYNFLIRYYDEEEGQFITEISEKGEAGLAQAYINLKHRFNEELTFVGGVHYMQFLLNNSNSIEPRAALKWQFRSDQSLTLGAGVHSKTESLTNYFSIYKDAFGNDAKNDQLDLTKAAHFVLGYDRNLSQNLYFKTEVYYQYLYDIPVENDITSSYATSNSYGWFTNRALVNDGVGQNFGWELTLEKYFADNYHFLFTASLYESQYKAKDDIWRSSRFNGNYAGNFIFGKEFDISKGEKNRAIGLDGKVLLIGGQRQTPIDLEASRAAGKTVRDVTKTFEQKMDDIFQLNVAAYYRFNRKKTTHEFKIDIQNATNYQAALSDYYNSRTGNIEDGELQLPFFPVASYRIEF